MAERELNKRIRSALFGFDPRRVENAVGPGTPDINFTGGWIESKWLPAWPARAGSVVKVPKYVPKQRGWHTKRRSAGGLVWVVIEIGSDVLVFDAQDAAPGLGHWTKEQMLRRAKLVMSPWDGRAFRHYIVKACETWIAF